MHLKISSFTSTLLSFFLSRRSQLMSWISHVWGENKLAKTVSSGSLAPRFVNNDCVAAERIYPTAHARHEVPAWSGVQCCTQIGVSPKKQQHSCCITAVSSWVSHERTENSVSAATAACAWQKRGCVVLGYAMAAASSRRE